MADVNINKFRASVVRDGSKPASPGFIVSEGQDPVDPAGNGQNHLPVTIATAATGLSITDSQVLGGAGTVGQYIRGDGSLADFPQASGGGSSVSYYLNGSISQGTIGGVAYKELNKVPILGAGTDFTINADGYIASFLTDAGDPNLLEIPGGNWNFETYFSASSSGGTPTFYVELYKYDGTTFTLIASSSSSPELIAFGTNLNPYFSTLAVPTTTLALTDRLAVRYYVNHSGRTITLHTENNHLCQVVTTFTTGLTSLNGLTAQVQNLAVGTSGTDFNIASATATHTFNLPTASATNRGALSSADWTTFNNKQNALTNPVTGTGTSGQVAYFTGTSAISSESNLFWDATNDRLGIGGLTTSYKLQITNSSSLGITISTVGSDSANPHIQMLNGAIDTTIAATSSGLELTAYSAHALLLKSSNVERFRIFALGNVHIGPTPASDNGARLQVSGTANFSGSIQAATESNIVGTSVNARMLVTASSVANTVVGFNNSGSTTTGVTNNTAYLGVLQDFPLVFTTNSVERFRLAASTGAATFSSSVTANGISSIGQEQAFTWQRTTGTASDVYSLNADGSSAYLYNNTTAKVLMYWAEGGNVGIGTSSPEGKLTIEGTSAQPPTSGTTANSLLQLKGSLGNELNIGSNTVAGNYGAYIQSSDNNLAVPYQLNLQPTGGNVIIGSYTDNGARLQVSGTATISGVTSLISSTPVFNLTSTSASGYSEVYFYRNTNSLTAYISSGVNENVTASGDAFVFDNRISGGNMVFRTNGGSGATERLRIASTGAATFDTTSAISSIFNSTNASGGYLAFRRSGTNIGYLGNSAQLGIGVNNALELRADNNLYLTTTSGTLAMLSSGNVGIGTASPDARLTVTSATVGGYGTGTPDIAIRGNVGGNATALQIYRTAATGGNIVIDSFRSGVGAAALILNAPNGGNVLIGTTTDNGARLQVAATSAIVTVTSTTGTSFNGIELKNSGGSFYVGQDSSTGGFYGSGTAYSGSLYVSGAHPLVMFTSGTERMRITSVGRTLLLGSTSSGWENSSRALLELNNTGSSLLGLRISGNERAYFYHNNNHLYIEQMLAGGSIYVISVSAGVYLTAGATSWTANSDERLKNINGNIENAVDKLMTLRTINYSWKNDLNQKENLGLIAQDVEKVFPQVIDINKLPSKPNQEQEDETEYLGVRYQELIPVLVKAIQELKQEINNLKN